MRARRACVLFGLVCLAHLAAGPAAAVTVDFTNAGGDWFWGNPSNWSPSAPGSGDTVRHNSTIASPILVNGAYTIQRLDMADKEISSGTENIRVTWEESGAGRLVTILNDVTIGRQGTNSNTSSDGLRGYLTTDGIDLTIGSPSQRATVTLGYKSYGQNSNVTGSITVSNGAFTLYATSLVLGNKDGTGRSGSGTGVLDLDEPGTTSLVDVLNNVSLGSLTGAYTYGTLRMLNGVGTVGGSLSLSHAADGAKGYVYLTNTPFTVGTTSGGNGRVNFWGEYNATDYRRRYAQVWTDVAGHYSGLDILTDTNGISFQTTRGAPYNLIDITFSADPGVADPDGWYWGLRWQGDHESYLEGLLSEANARLVIHDSALSDAWRLPGLADYIIYNSETGYTYVGFEVVVPEPSTLVLAALGSLVLARRRRARAARR
ncbi:MAG TPA: PEP-CTERM sorting domain-containing protein [Planctomycetota bacterium]|nr:PEP-CTERM sorting domain-containing protein [Planctomycetota bacterium]